MIWPGVAEELVGTKAIYVRDGFFKDVDITLFSHVSSDMKAAWGTQASNALVSVRYDFSGAAAHSAGAPWRGKSALDAVELMNVGWNYRREHLKYTQRSHYVIPDGGDQPNVVPSKGECLVLLPRDRLHEHQGPLGHRQSRGPGRGDDDRHHVHVDRARFRDGPPHEQAGGRGHEREHQARGHARPGMRTTRRLAKAVQKELAVKEEGLATKVSDMEGPVDDKTRTGSGSDDIGDIQWNTPSVTLRYPANIPNLPGHSFWNGIAMATPIAHKGSTAGAKVMATTMLDLFAKPRPRGRFVEVLQRGSDERAQVHLVPERRPTSPRST